VSSYSGHLEAYWEQGYEGRIEYSLYVEGLGHPHFINEGDHLTIYAENGSTLWAGKLHFVPIRSRETHSLPYGIWASSRPYNVSYQQWLAWFTHKPPLKATLEEIGANMQHEEMPDHADVKIHPPVLTALHLIAAILLKWFVLRLASPVALEWVGIGLVVLGFCFAGAAVLEFRKAQTTVLPHGSVSAIISSGIFRFTRNPIYLSFLLMIIGFPLYLDTWWGLVLAPVFVYSANRLVIQHEEAYLEKKFGEGYTRYKRSVRRWI